MQGAGLISVNRFFFFFLDLGLVFCCGREEFLGE